MLRRSRALWGYHRMLRQANAALNLTRIHNFENMVLKHYVDSLLVLKYVELPETLIDMGSGPGLPGIPLKIARPEVRMILAEPRGARAAFLRDVCGELGLRANRGLRSQARSGLSRTGRRRDQPRSRSDHRDARPRGIVPGGRRQNDLHEGTGLRSRSRRGREIARELFRLAADHAYTIPGTTHDRRLVVFERRETEQRRLAPRERSSRAVSCAPAGVRRSLAGDLERDQSDLPALSRYLGGPGIRKHGEAILSGARIRSEVLAGFPTACWAG